MTATKPYKVSRKKKETATNAKVGISPAAVERRMRLQ
jgi:hypothetical protein